MSPPNPAHDLARISGIFRQALDSLGVSYCPGEAADWSALVHRCMSGRARRFHDVAHIFEISETADDPIELLAALFHDAVYYQIDGGLSDDVCVRIGSAILERPDSVVFVADDGDDLAQLVAGVFDVVAGCNLLPSAGLNEFLSALLAVRSLAPVLSRAQLVQLAACIEATIPFRPCDQAGRSPADTLFERLLRINAERDVGMSIDEVELTVCRAVDLANHDLANFALDNVAQFLDHTWDLLPESNYALRSRSLYSIAEYWTALRNMEGFFASLPAERVFRGFRGCPSPDTLDAMIRAARRNIDIGLRYLRVKRLSASLLVAVAELTGGDAPISLFMGKPPYNGGCVSRVHACCLEDLLPEIPARQADDISPEVLELLIEGRGTDSEFERKHSPLASFLYPIMGDAGTSRALRTMDENPSDPLRWLLALPTGAVVPVIVSCKRLAPERFDLLSELEQRFHQGLVTRHMGEQVE
ncbi:MAG: hypothetical protein MJE77_24640 [Proteobacteria bacterium]|nr:hypothetical protein [Pseudomonadota bacterium]